MSIPNPELGRPEGDGAAADGTPRGQEPMLSASGDLLAFSSVQVPWGEHPAAVNLDGGDSRLWPDAERGGWLRLSPDGGRLLRTIVDPLRGNPDVWVEDLARGTRVRVTTTSSFDVSPVWSTDGRRIAFRAGTASKAHLALAAADGTGNPVVLPGGSPFPQTSRAVRRSTYNRSRDPAQNGACPRTAEHECAGIPKAENSSTSHPMNS